MMNNFMYAPRLNILGVGINCINMDLALETIDGWIAMRDRRFVTVTGVHGVMECQRDERLRHIHNCAGLVTPDGMPMVWIGNWHGYQQMDRVCGRDIMTAVCARSPARGYRNFLYGGAKGVADRLGQQLCQRHPGLKVVGTYSPPFRMLTPEEDAAEMALINEAAPDIVWVGLSTPKQERWMDAHRDRLSAPVLIGVGAAFDMHAGLKPMAPIWVQRTGFEWLFRLMVEPRRLWRRYLRNNPAFILRVLQQELGLRRYSLGDWCETLGNTPALTGEQSEGDNISPGASRHPLPRGEGHIAPVSLNGAGQQFGRQAMKNALVLGAGGFIGSHLVKRLKREGFWVRGVDLKYPQFSETAADDFLIGDLRDPQFCRSVIDQRFVEIYQLAADMGGAGYIFTGDNDADIMHNSAMINLNVLEACQQRNNKLIFYSSSACVYPKYNQECPDHPNTSEDSAYPAEPDSEYGWEKLFSERLYLAFQRKYGINVRIARYHNIFGPEGAWNDGKEKAPAALCRKVAVAPDGGEIEIWGDGRQTRSFLFIDECLEGTLRLARSNWTGPVNIGSVEMVSIGGLAQRIMEIAGKRLRLRHVPGPQGVRGRCSDNLLIAERLNWQPTRLLQEGLQQTYRWIAAQIARVNFDGCWREIEAGRSKRRS